MACPHCDHTMESLCEHVFWCPRCGAYKSKAWGDCTGPWLVDRVRELYTEVARSQGFTQEVHAFFERLGILESIFLPGERPQGPPDPATVPTLTLPVRCVSCRRENGIRAFAPQGPFWCSHCGALSQGGAPQVPSLTSAFHEMIATATLLARRDGTLDREGLMHQITARMLSEVLGQIVAVVERAQPGSETNE